MMFEYKSNSIEETHQFAAEILKKLPLHTFISLNGDLGAGKTEFVRGIGEALGIHKILSPTFTLIREYDSCPKLYHFDVYRIHSADELYDIGFEDYLKEKDALIIMEWSANVPEALPKDILSIDVYGSGESERTFQIYSDSSIYNEVFQ